MYINLDPEYGQFKQLINDGFLYVFVQGPLSNGQQIRELVVSGLVLQMRQ